MAAIMSDPPKVDGKAQLKSEDMDDSHPVHAPSSLSNNSSTLPGTPSSDHSVFNDSFASTQAQPANSAAGHESESEDTSESMTVATILLVMTPLLTTQWPSPPRSLQRELTNSFR
jgi:hypothetical protein